MFKWLKKLISPWFYITVYINTLDDCLQYHIQYNTLTDSFRDTLSVTWFSTTHKANINDVHAVISETASDQKKYGGEVIHYYKKLGWLIHVKEDAFCSVYTENNIYLFSCSYKQWTAFYHTNTDMLARLVAQNINDNFVKE